MKRGQMPDLQNNLRTNDGWQIIEKTFDPDSIVTTVSNFMIGNSYRGTFAEWEQEHDVACTATDTWDTTPVAYSVYENQGEIAPGETVMI
jgi:hypothetical protein